MSKLHVKLIAALLTMSITLAAQSAYNGNGYDEYDDYSYYDGFMGDNFSLQGALEMFKASNTIEDFEYRINRERNRINNLDLNGDGRIDYIRVNSFAEDRRSHVLVLQAVMGRKEVQDVAVIAIEKTGSRVATLQIIGDEYLYGPDVILEPGDIAYDQDFRGRGPNVDVNVTRHFVNVWYWPSVRFLFGYGYRPYRSPYYWGYYPRAWNPWNPYAYNVYYDYCRPYRRPFWVFAPRVRIVYVNNFYRPRRVYSPVVRNRWDRYRARPNYRSGRRTIAQTRPADRPNRGARGNVRNDRGGNSDRIRNTRGAYQGDIERPRTPTTDRGSRGGAVANTPRRNTTTDRNRGNFTQDRARSNDRATSTTPQRSNSSRGNRSSISSNPSRTPSAKSNRSSRSSSASTYKAPKTSRSSASTSRASKAPSRSSASSSSGSRSSASASRSNGRSSSASKSRSSSRSSAKSSSSSKRRGGE